eukprot:gene5094-7102_t
MEKPANRFIPQFQWLQYPFLLWIGTFLFTQNSITAFIMDGLVKFWHNGIHGMSWFGKVYFGLAVACVFILKWFFTLFERESRSWHVMHWSLKIIGLLFLSNGTSSKDLSILLVTFGIFPDYILHMIRLFYMIMISYLKKPTYKYIGKKMTISEVEELSKKTTERELMKLKLYLKSKPSVLHKYSDKFNENDKPIQMKLLNRFVDGTYPV